MKVTSRNLKEENSRIHVCARLRPVIEEDFKLGSVTRSSPEICVHLRNDGQTVKMVRDNYDVKLFRVDHTFDSVASQLDVYNSSFKRIVIEALNGYNGTGMVYGQTGSGKTFTMFGTAADPGVLQLAVTDVFDAVNDRISRGLVANVFLSFYQLYMEQAYDLLHPSTSEDKIMSVPLNIREDAKKGAYVENLQYLYVDDEETTIEILQQGLQNRNSQATVYNIRSSRSHAIFQMYLDFEEEDDVTNKNNTEAAVDQYKNQPSRGSIESKKDSAGDEEDTASSQQKKKQESKCDVRRRVLTFVDLAGSERAQPHLSRSKKQFKEAVAINKSISSLGNCIQALANLANNSRDENNRKLKSSQMRSTNNNMDKNNKKTGGHVPFRDSKLTWLLAEPLGGNSKTCIIVNIGPCMYNFEETRSTLQFASRAMTVQKHVEKGEVERLRVENILVEHNPHGSSPPQPGLGCINKLSNVVMVSRIVVRDNEEEEHKEEEDEDENASNGGVPDSRISVDGQDKGAERLSNVENTEYDDDYDRHNNDANRPHRHHHQHHHHHHHHHQRKDYIVELPSHFLAQEEGLRDGDETLPAPVRLNLGDFLKACQHRPTVPLAASKPPASLTPSPQPPASFEEDSDGMQPEQKQPEVLPVAVEDASLILNSTALQLLHPSNQTKHLDERDTAAKSLSRLSNGYTADSFLDAEMSNSNNKNNNNRSPYLADTMLSPIAMLETTVTNLDNDQARSAPQNLSLFSPEALSVLMKSSKAIATEKPQVNADNDKNKEPSHGRGDTTVKSPRKVVWERGSGSMQSVSSYIDRLPPQKTAVASSREKIGKSKMATEAGQGEEKDRGDQQPQEQQQQPPMTTISDGTVHDYLMGSVQAEGSDPNQDNLIKKQGENTRKITQYLKYSPSAGSTTGLDDAGAGAADSDDDDREPTPRAAPQPISSPKPTKLQVADLLGPYAFRKINPAADAFPFPDVAVPGTKASTTTNAPTSTTTANATGTGLTRVTTSSNTVRNADASSSRKNPVNDATTGKFRGKPMGANISGARTTTAMKGADGGGSGGSVQEQVYTSSPERAIREDSKFQRAVEPLTLMSSLDLLQTMAEADHVVGASSEMSPPLSPLPASLSPISTPTTAAAGGGAAVVKPPSLPASPQLPLNAENRALMSLVFELRNELQKKDEEISSLRHFILDN